MSANFCSASSESAFRGAANEPSTSLICFIPFLTVSSTSAGTFTSSSSVRLLASIESRSASNSDNRSNFSLVSIFNPFLFVVPLHPCQPGGELTEARGGQGSAGWLYCLPRWLPTPCQIGRNWSSLNRPGG